MSQRMKNLTFEVLLKTFQLSRFAAFFRASKPGVASGGTHAAVLALYACGRQL